jgi:hypothetical protein
MDKFEHIDILARKTIHALVGSGATRINKGIQLEPKNASRDVEDASGGDVL